VHTAKTGLPEQTDLNIDLSENNFYPEAVSHVSGIALKTDP